MNEKLDLKDRAREIFAAALRDVDAGRAVRAVMRRDGARLTIVDDEFDLDACAHVCAVGLGKAAGAMASALADVLGARLTRGVLSAPAGQQIFAPRWQVFTGGHPLPNEASVAAGHAARELLRASDAPDTLLLFLVSGGGSAMMELPRDARVTLADLRTTNRVLVNCGAPIAAMNAVRRALSALKGGGLSALAPRAVQVSLIVSDTNPREAAQVASGPTYARTGDETQQVAAVIEQYQLRGRLPAAVLRALDEARAQQAVDTDEAQPAGALRRHHVLLDNERAQAAAAHAARACGCAVELCADLIEAPVEDGCRELVERLLRLRRAAQGEQTVCLISGGEFICPVRGRGTGGRNLEAALHCAVEFQRHADEIARAGWRVAALHAGTDGVDGNSPAAGAVADETTIERARASGLDATEYLARSDAYNFFHALGDTIETGPTGTNVRDLRILLAN